MIAEWFGLAGSSTGSMPPSSEMTPRSAIDTTPPIATPATDVTAPSAAGSASAERSTCPLVASAGHSTDSRLRCAASGANVSAKLRPAVSSLHERASNAASSLADRRLSFPHHSGSDYLLPPEDDSPFAEVITMDMDATSDATTAAARASQFAPPPRSTWGQSEESHPDEGQGHGCAPDAAQRLVQEDRREPHGHDDVGIRRRRGHGDREPSQS